MSKKVKPQPMIDASHIRDEAEKIRSIAQSIIDACNNGTMIDSFARAKAVGGSLAGDAATLGIMIVHYEFENGY